MSRPKWSRISTQVLVSTPYYRFAHDRYVLPRRGEGDYYYIDIPGSAMVVPELPDGQLVLVRQHRYLMDRASLEFPAGGIGDGATPELTARAELAEEAGYRAGRLEALGAFAPYNGVSNEMCHVFVARALAPVPRRPEDTEEIEVVTLAPAQLAGRIAAGEVWDGMTLASFQLYRQGRGAPV